MSHITRVKTQMMDREFVLRALDDLSYQYEANDDVFIGGYLAPRQKVDIKVSRGFFRGPLGLRKSGRQFEVLASSDLVRRSLLTEFTHKLTQRYAYHAVREKLHAQGFNLVSEDLQQDGRLSIVLRRAV